MNVESPIIISNWKRKPYKVEGELQVNCNLWPSVYWKEINVRENRTDNQEWTIRGTGNVGHKTHTKWHRERESNTDHANNKKATRREGRFQVIAKGNLFLLLGRHPPCYSYIQSSRVDQHSLHACISNVYYCHTNRIIIIFWNKISDNFSHWNCAYFILIMTNLTYQWNVLYGVHPDII